MLRKTDAIMRNILNQHLTLTGKVGSGKTYVAKGLVERLLGDGQRVCIVDPTGVWWGLRYMADGERPGFPIVIFGGEHADVPITEHSGAVLGTLFANESVIAGILDVSEFTMGERRRFLTDFFRELHRHNRRRIHLIVDEADEVAPQNPMPETKHLLHEFDRIVRRGRVRGFCVCMITQRPAVLHKNVLTQSNALIAMKLTSPQDRNALGDWIEHQADKGEGRTVMASLASLKLGEGWLWAPEQECLTRMQFPRIETFDSSATPDGFDGHALMAPTNRAPVDLAAITDALKAAEPAQIGKVVSEAVPALDIDVEVLQATAHAAGHAAGRAEGWEAALGAVRDALRPLFDDDSAAPVPVRDETEAAARLADYDFVESLAKERAPAANVAANVALPVNGGRYAPGQPMQPVQRKFLTVLAQRNPAATTRNQLAILAGYSAKSRHVDNVLASLRSAGWAVGPRDELRLTPPGRKALGHFEPLPKGAALRDYWFAQLDKAPSQFLQELCRVYPKTLSRDDVAQRAGYSAASRHVDNSLAALRTRELIEGDRKALKASSVLF